MKHCDGIIKSADQGNSNGQYSVGFCYANGQGAEKDVDEAIKWFRKVCGARKSQWTIKFRIML